MPQRVMRAIANPAQLFWAPVELALLNFVVGAVFMVIGFNFGLNPLWTIVLLLLNHTGLAFVGAREQHAYNILMAMSKSNVRTRNIIKSKGNKFVP